MNKKILLGVVVVGLAVFGVYVAFCPSQNIIKKDVAIPVVADGARSEKDATYKINGMSVTLKNGVAEMEAAPGSVSKIITRYFGNEVRHDFDGDGSQDVAFLVTQETGGSGTFYYAVVALNTPVGYVGSDAVLLGDRIAPQSTEMGEGNVVIVNYADRNPGESFAVKPSLGKSMWLLLDPKTIQLGEVAQNFEGEASPAVMKLDMKKWDWVSTIYNDGKVVTPKDPTRFSITFNANKTFSASTDCNGIGGEYAVMGGKISFTKMMSTLMYCEGAQEGEYSKMLSDVTSYRFTSKGELVFDMIGNSGMMTFK